MKKIVQQGLAMFLSLLLTACANYHGYTQSQSQRLLCESWMNQVNTNPHLWTRQADRWFTTGEPNQIEQYSRAAPVSDSMTTMSVRAPNFTTIDYNGSYQVQIIGYQDHNGVYVMGPNDQTRKVVVKTIGNTLYLRQAKDCVGPLDKVIVRVGIRDLRHLIIKGNGTILGRNISSGCLSIYSCGRNRVFLDGNINLTQLEHYGTGIITVTGAVTPSLRLKVIGPGCVNIGGKVGVEKITHLGSGTVNIIGADTDGLCIIAGGNGLTAIYGFVNLKRVYAIDGSQVYVYWVNSNCLNVFERGNAHVGLAGITRNLKVDMMEGARFDGRYLNSNSVYARTRNISHANIRTNRKLFAVALDSSSIYYAGNPSDVSRYTSKNGVLLPICVS